MRKLLRGPGLARAAKGGLSLAAAAIVAVVLAGCGSGSGSGSSGSGGGGGQPTVSASVSSGVQVFDLTGLASDHFSSTTLVAHPGRIRIVFSVPQGSAPHDVTFKQPPLAGKTTGTVSSGQSATLDVTIDRPGTYPFECTFHPDTMQARLIVQG